MATEQEEAVREEEPLAPVAAGAVLPGVAWVAKAWWPPVVGVRAALEPRLAWASPSRLEGR